MTTIEHTDPTTAATDTDPLPREPVGHIGRITALSLTTAAAAAMILAVGVFEGATEPVITGVV